MKILITTDWYLPTINGVVASVGNLASGLRKLGHDVRILTLSEDVKPRHSENVYAVGSLGVGKVYPGARVEYAYPLRHMRSIIDWRPDVVHSQCEFSTFPLARHVASACEAPLVHTYHTVYEDYAHYFCPNARLGRKLAGDFSRYVLQRTNCVIAPTAKVKSLLEGYGVTRPIYTIPSGFDLSRFAREMTDMEREDFRRGIGLARTDKALVYVGRMAREKHIDELIDLFSRLDMPDAYLVLVGDGPERAALERAAAQSGAGGRVIFTGMAAPEDVWKYYRAGDVFVTASRSETQGLTYAEAMASGLTALCRKDPCLNDLISDGENGFLYETPEEFLAKARMLLGDAELTRQIGARAKESVKSRFTIEAFAGSAQNVYRQALDNRLSERNINLSMPVRWLHRAQELITEAKTCLR